jgi:hypothetical protein
MSLHEHLVSAAASLAYFKYRGINLSNPEIVITAMLCAGLAPILQAKANSYMKNITVIDSTVVLAEDAAVALAMTYGAMWYLNI